MSTNECAAASLVVSPVWLQRSVYITSLMFVQCYAKQAAVLSVALYMVVGLQLGVRQMAEPCTDRRSSVDGATQCERRDYFISYYCGNGME